MAGERRGDHAAGEVVGADPGVPTLSREGRRVTLAARTIVGRDPSCELRLTERRVSGLHARISWAGERWVVRDLGSTNGTFVDGVRLPPGVDRPLRRGSRVAFGVPEDSWLVEDLAPPGAVAIHTLNGEIVREDSGLLGLDDGGDGLCVLTEGEGGWVAVGLQGSRCVTDGEILALGEATWRLRLPVHGETTHRSMADGDLPVTLAFRVGADEETLRTSVFVEGRQHELPPRSCHYLLLTLARARVADHAAGVGVLQAGWRHVDEICRLLGADANQVNVHIHRLRKQLDPLGVPKSIIERRKGDGYLRVGVSRLIIRPD